jgi:hypothetical protein
MNQINEIEKFILLKSQRNSQGIVKPYELIVEHELIYKELLALNKQGPK